MAFNYTKTGSIVLKGTFLNKDKSLAPENRMQSTFIAGHLRQQNDKLNDTTFAKYETWNWYCDLNTSTNLIKNGDILIVDEIEYTIVGVKFYRISNRVKLNLTRNITTPIENPIA